MKAAYCIIPLLLLLLSCDRPECNNTIPVFDQYPPDSKPYKEELVKQIKKRGRHKLDYWIHNNSYIKKDGKEYMMIWVQDDELCAKAMLDITGTDKLGNYQQVNGQSYGGAKLMGLEYSIENDSNGYHFIFKDVDDILD